MDRRPSTFVAVALSLVLLTEGIRAQDGAECAVVECARAAPTDASPAMRRLWTLATAAHAIKIEFVNAAQQLAVIQAAPLVASPSPLPSHLATMRAVLARWDDAVRQLETAAAPHLRVAETHVALGTAYLDRHRTSDAIRSLTEASRIDRERSDVHASLALAYGLEGRNADEIRELRLAASLAPRNAAIAYDLAHALRMAGRAEEARQALQQVIRLRSAAPVPSGAAARVQPFDRVEFFRQPSGVAPLFSYFRFITVFDRLRRGQYEMAMEELARVNVLPQPGEEQRQQGLELWVAGDHNGAVRELRQALVRQPGDDRARLALALVLRAAGRPSEAEQQLRAADEPFTGFTWYRLGQLFESQSRLADAARAFQASTASAPILGRDALYQRLARVLVNQADFDGAVTAYANRITINPNSAETHRSLAEIYFLQGRDDEALAELLVAVWLDPMDARAFAALGKVHVRAQRYAEALPALRRAVALDAARADARYALGQALARTGRPDDARVEIAEFERLEAAERAKGQRDFRVEQSRVEAARLLAAGDADGAIALLGAIAAEEPQNARWQRELGAAFLRARRFPESVAALEAAQAREPTLDAERLLADAYAAAGRTTDAREHQARYDEALRRIRVEQLITGEL